MASNSFGKIFKITTFGESHGKEIGVVIDGCPSGLKIDEEYINQALELRAGGKSACTTPRKETDIAEIMSGVFEGKTTGAPICITIKNQDADSSKYEPIKDILRPGHANFTYLKKFGIFDYKGGGRASARETACRVAAGAIALKFLEQNGILVSAYLKQVGNVVATIPDDFDALEKNKILSPIFCPDLKASNLMTALIEEVKQEGDSIGGVVEFIVLNAVVGLGSPVYEKLEAILASAMMSIPAAKGFEIGDGFESVTKKGSEHNDLFIKTDHRVETSTNHAGGILAGITTGMPIIGRVAFKPTSSIKGVQNSLTIDGEPCILELPTGSRHDACVAIRAVAVVKAMAAIVLADALLCNRGSRC